MNYKTINEYTGEWSDIGEYSHPEERKELIAIAKYQLKKYLKVQDD